MTCTLAKDDVSSGQVLLNSSHQHRAGPRLQHVGRAGAAHVRHDHQSGVAGRGHSVGVGVRQTLDLEHLGKRLEHEPLEIPCRHRAATMPQALAAAPEVVGAALAAPPAKRRIRLLDAADVRVSVHEPRDRAGGQSRHQVLLEVLERQAAGLEAGERAVSPHGQSARRALRRTPDERAQPHQTCRQAVMLEGCVSRHGDRDQPGPLEALCAVDQHRRRDQGPPRIFSGEVAPLGVARLQHLRRAGGADVDLEKAATGWRAAASGRCRGTMPRRRRSPAPRGRPCDRPRVWRRTGRRIRNAPAACRSPGTSSAVAV